jgi:undecaprenyl-diphosphatase
MTQRSRKSARLSGWILMQPPPDLSLQKPMYWICHKHMQSLRLHLMVGIVVLAVAGLLFGLIAENVVSGGALTIIDIHLAQWLHEHSTPLLTQCLLIVTHLHDPFVISPVAILIALALIWKKEWFAAVAVLLAVQGGMLLNLLVKQAFHRARPSFEDPLVTLTTYSFPSGHVVASTVFYGVLAALLISETPSCRRALYILLTALAMVALVAFSRMYVGAHYLSDVLAAFLEGIAWLALCLTAIQICRGYHATES